MLQKPFSRYFKLLVALLLSTKIALSAIPVVHISPKPTWINAHAQYDKPVAQRNIVNGYFYKLIEQQINVELKANYKHIIKQIVSPAGIQNASEISISFDPTYQRLDVHEIVVWRDNKPQRRISTSSFKMIADETELSKFIYQGSYSAYCILDDIRKGDRIEYSYTISGRNPIFGNHYSDNIFLQVSQPVAHVYKALFAATSRKLYFKSFNKVPKTDSFTKNGLTCYSWENFQVPAAIDYDNQAGWYTSYGYIQVTDFKTWAEVAAWGLSINTAPKQLSGKLSERVASIKAATGDKREDYFRAAVKLVQDEVRYMGIETGEYSHRANVPEKVYNQRYGDCKDKSLLLVAILNAGGIEAHMALINTYASIKTDQYLPSPFDFNHAVVQAIVNGKAVWVDATMAYQRGTGTSIYFPEYGQGLVLKPGSNAIVNIPSTRAGKINYMEEYYIPNDTGNVSLDVTTVYTLNEADKIRSSLADASTAETEKSYLDYYARIYPKVESADSIMVYDNEDANEIKITEHYLIPEFASKNAETGRYEAGVYANFISERLPDANNNNKYPRAVNFPCNIDYTIKIHLSSGWNVETYANEIKADAYRFQSRTKAEGDTLVLNYKLNFLASYIAADQMEKYTADIKNIKDNELSYSFGYIPGETTINYSPNYLIIVLVLIAIAAASGFFAYIYRIKTPEVVFERGATFVPLGGWLIVVAIIIALTAVGIIFAFFNLAYFKLEIWNGLAGTKNEISLKILIAAEAVLNSIHLCYAMFCLITLFNKRDILPQYIIWFFIGSAGYIILDALAAYFISSKFSDETAMKIIRVVVMAAIWVPYFKMSSRVHETFIVPYPHGNYSYEEWGNEKKSDKKPLSERNELL